MVCDCLFSVSLQECFDSLLSVLHWSWTTLVLGVEELRGLKGFQYTATLLDLERLRFVGTCCLRLLRVYICEIFPIAGRSTENLEQHYIHGNKMTSAAAFSVNNNLKFELKK